MPNNPKHPCLACGKNVTSNAISCSVCLRWSHAACSDLEPAVMKYFETQKSQTGTHSWSCTGCNIAYSALNTRIKQIECRQKELEELAKANELANLKSSARLDTAEEDIKGLKEDAKRDKEDIIKDVTGRWSSEMREREARRSNLVVYGLEEPSYSIKGGQERQAEDKRIAGDLFNAIRVRVNNSDVKFAARIGKLTQAIADKPRPLKISFRSQNVRENLFNNAKFLPRSGYSHVSIVPDLTDQQREEDKNLFEEAERLNSQLDESENFEYRCMGRKGERTICKMRKLGGQSTQQSRNLDMTSARSMREDTDTNNEPQETTDSQQANKRARQSTTEEETEEDESPNPNRSPNPSRQTKKKNKENN